MKPIHPFFALALLAVSVAAPAQTQNILVPLSRPGEPISLEIGIHSADIEVIGEARNDVSIDVSISGGSRKIVTPSGAKSLAGGGYSLEVEEDDNAVEVNADWRANKVTLVARIPRRADLELSTIDNGEISVSNVEGSLSISNINGPISARDVSGAVIAESINQDIDVHFTRVAADGASSFESINGDLYVTLPSSAGVEVHLDTRGGQIFSDFEVDIKPTEPVMERDERGGSTRIRIESVIIADINGGGPTMRLKSLEGDIYIKKAE